MAYQREWRRLHASGRALAQFDSSDEDVQQNLGEVQEEDVCAENDRESTDSTDSSTELRPPHDSSDGTISSDTDDNPVPSFTETGNPMPPVSINEELASWCTRNKSTHRASNELLDILRRHGLDQLPKDVRTLLQTPRTVQTVNRCGGKYAYFGLEAAVVRVLSHAPVLSPDHSIDLIVNVDGLPLFKSSNVQLWPILCYFDNFTPFVVALYCGEQKPNSVEDYLCDFLQEYGHLKETGITYDSQTYSVTIKAFVCDAPARAFLKCITGHTGYYSCERCQIRGSWNGRVILDCATTCPARTEEQFDGVQYENHQSGVTPLINAGIRCISQFPLDYMHMICLGVVRRMLSHLRRGLAVCRLSPRQRGEISERLVGFKGQMPREFARQPRSLTELDRWKATEYRQFLLYTGPVVLRNVVTDRVYKHYICLTVAVSVLLNSFDGMRQAYLEYAEKLLVQFVNQCKHVVK